MKSKTWVFLCVLMFCLIMVPATGKTAIMFQDDFNAENGGSGVLNFNGFVNWMVLDGTVDLIGNGYFDFLPGNGLYVDLDGSTNDAGMLVSIPLFVLEPGFEYTLSFDLAGNQRNDSPEMVTVQVAMGNVFSEDFSLSKTDPFTTFERTFSVADFDLVDLSFQGLGGDNIGMLLDNVVLESRAVPEPTTLLLLGTGLLGLLGFRRKFRS